MNAGLFPRRRDVILPQGRTPARLAAQTKRSLDNIREQLGKLALPWDEIDNSVDGQLQELLSAFDKFERHVQDSVKWLEEAAP